MAAKMRIWIAYALRCNGVIKKILRCAYIIIERSYGELTIISNFDVNFDS